MKSASVRELRNHYKGLLDAVALGEEITITCRGTPVARLCPMATGEKADVDWSGSPEVLRSRTKAASLTAEESASLIQEASGQW